jgi:CheY-like chemotaxis protein
LGAERHVVTSGSEALAAARRIRPKLAILDVKMPDVDGEVVCAQIKADPELAGCRVILVTTGVMERGDLDRFAHSGCDDILVLPAVGEEVFSRVAHLIGVPHRRSRRVPLRVSVKVDASGQTATGETENLSCGGAMVKLDHDLPTGAEVDVELTDPRTGQAIPLEARVIWAKPGAHTAGFAFHPPVKQARQALDALVLWEVVPDDEGVVRVFLEGDFAEATDFAGLRERLQSRVDFDAAGIRYINSHGVRHWVGFVERLKDLAAYTFSRCSIAFITQASLIANFLGHGRVTSFFAPMHCGRCDREEERLLQVAALVVEHGEVVAPTLRCSTCSAALALDENPDSYFAFLRLE